MNSKQIWSGAVLAAAAFVAPLPAAQAQMAEAVAAIVNDHVITTYDVRQRANLLLISAGMESTPELQQRARAQALRELEDEQLQLQETVQFDIAITDAEVDRRLTDIARSNNATLEEFQATLTEAGVGIGTLRNQLRVDMAWNRLMGGLYGTRLRISPLEVRATQERIAASSTRPQFLISEIFLPAETEAEFAEVEAGALRLLQEMQRGAPFPLVARQFSASTSAANNGDLGWVAAGEMTAEVQAVVERLQPGQVSMPVRTPSGYYIVAVRERREGQPAGSSTQISLRQITAPAARRAGLERIQRRLSSCATIDREVATVEGAQAVDLGATAEIDLSEAIRARIADVDSGHATTVEVVGDQASILVVCGRETSGGGVPSREEIENRLYEQELALLSERYLRNLRREARIDRRS